MRIMVFHDNGSFLNEFINVNGFKIYRHNGVNAYQYDNNEMSLKVKAMSYLEDGFIDEESFT